MQYRKKTLFKIIILLSVFLCTLAGTWTAEASEKFGAILVVHGGMVPERDQDFSTLHQKMNNRFDCPVEIAYLGYIGEMTLTNAIKKLIEEEEVTQILLVHVTPSSYSYNEQVKSFAEEEVVKLKNLSTKPPTAKCTIEIVAMDDHPIALEILKEYARTTSGQAGEPEKESLMLIGGGPIEELENTLSVIDLERIGERVRKELGFKEVVCMNLRTHSPDVIYVRSINNLQRAAERLKAQGRVIVVPYVAQNDFHKKLESFLKGIIPPEDINKSEITSHPKIEQWAAEVINGGVQQPQIKQVNRNWSVMKDERGQPKSTHNYGLAEN